MPADSTDHVLDERPYPWIIALGITPESEIGLALEKTGGTVAYRDHLGQVRQEDFHFLVCTYSPVDAVSDNLEVLQFLSAHHPHGALASYSAEGSEMSLKSGSRASLFTVGTLAVELGMKPLVERTVLRDFERASVYDVMELDGNADGAFRPLAGELNGEAIGGVYRNTCMREWWLLPAETADAPSWVEPVFSLWKQRRPEILPADFMDPEDTWMTLAERKAQDAIHEHLKETAKLLEARDREILHLKEDALRISEDAQSKERRLLYSNGDDLVAAVADALTRLGFDVVDSDVKAAAKGTPKREDLRLKLASEPEWVGLAEVKGKSRAAAVRDVDQLAKAGAIYHFNEGRMPNAEWYIVNANNLLPPSARPEPLGTSGEDVDFHAATNNLAVIDTRRLFILLREVEAESLDLAVAQDSLLAARGIYDLPQSTNFAMVVTDT